MSERESENEGEGEAGTPEEFADSLNEFQRKWRDEWEDESLFEADPSDEDKFYITVAYPYPSGGMHVGHVRTFALPDVFARFKRMQGYNVLFPMAWHVTGTPIIGALNRLKEGEEEQLHVLRDVYDVPEDELEAMEEPMDFARYFIENSYKTNMRRLGFSVDWRREFTTNDDQYQRFIEWQYRRLKEKGLVEQGLHPTSYCLKDENPVTAHDILEGEDAEKNRYSLVKFSAKGDGDDGVEGAVFPCATLRPETVYGVTHVMVNPSEEYVVAEVDGERWVVSEEGAEKLSYQDREVEEVERVEGDDLIGEELENPVTGDVVPLLPATFVDTDNATGVVMSVPAHAPYDWASLQDLKRDPSSLSEYGLEERVQELEAKKIIDVEGYDGLPAEEACEEHGVESQDDEEALEEATEEVYEKEFHDGVLNRNCGEFEGERVKDVKESLSEHFEEEGAFDAMYDFAERVVSRSGGKVIVSEQESWFLEYGDDDWKRQAREALDDLEIIPENKREEYVNTVDWLESWPCIRNYGLGTRLPFDDRFVIEPLSDSTVYMAFYTIRNIIEDVDPENLEPVFFDHVFNGEGTAEEVADETGVDVEILEEARESYDYWYPLDWRTSAQDLIQNHLTFMLYHHAALLGLDQAPRGVATWGMGLLEGEKMSSSKGHVVLPNEAMERFGPDTVRLFLFASVEPWQDFDWRADEVEKYMRSLRRFYNRSVELHGEGVEREPTSLDRYALSRLQVLIDETTEGMENFQTRKAGLNAFFELNDLVKTYRRRADEMNADVLKLLVETQIKMLAPFTPHVCEELWDRVGGEGFVSEADWPEYDEELRDREAEEAQKLVDRTVEDIREVSEFVEEFDEVRIVLADGWKRDLFEELRDVVEERPEFGEAMGRLVEGREENADTVKGYLQDYLDSPGELPDAVFTTDEEKKVIDENTRFLEDEFDATVVVEEESESEEEKASRAEPGRPAIILR
ncbi:MAG: leucine--tRNA ligase [Halobacteria archaeon]|nr:leucine--tRNA ligase [Halobacteria archaeon]